MLSIMTDLQKLILGKIDQGAQKTQAIVDSSTLGTDFKRSAYWELEQSLEIFLSDKTPNSQWTIITGLRGVGKTTLLAQLYRHPSLDTCAKFYLSLDELYSAGATMDDVTAAIEHRLKSKILNTQNPILIFLDEVHFLPQWSLAAKILYDNSRHLFLVCTGSSAISFWTNPDIGRRAKMISIPPLSFQEFRGIEGLYSELAIRQLTEEWHQTSQTPSLEAKQSGMLREVIFEAASAEETFKKLKALELQTPATNSSDQIDDYINFYGSMPYAAPIKRKHSYYEEKLRIEVHESGEQGLRPIGRAKAEKDIKDRILQTLNTLFLRDLEILGNFDTKTKNQFIRLLLLLANADSINLRKIAQDLSLNVLTVQNMLKALSDGEIIIPVAPVGASLGKIAKPYKYLFNSPALRLALSPLYLNAGDKISPLEIGRLRGCLLEDAIAMYLKRLFINRPVSGILEYDAAAGGADFIVMPRGLKSEAIILEVGYNKTTGTQVAKTLARFKDRHGLVVTNCKLGLDKQNNAVFIPLETFFKL